MGSLGKLLVLTGAVIALVGVLLLLGDAPPLDPEAARRLAEVTTTTRAGRVLPVSVLSDDRVNVLIVTGGTGIYHDEGSTGWRDVGNVCWNCTGVNPAAGGGFHQHYGRENHLENNILPGLALYQTRTWAEVKFRDNMPKEEKAAHAEKPAKKPARKPAKPAKKPELPVPTATFNTTGF